MNATIEAAELLITARQNRHRLNGFPDCYRPHDTEAAYAIQSVLTILANTLCDQGSWLRAGDLISTGVCCDAYVATSGDNSRADFGKLGVVEVSF